MISILIPTRDRPKKLLQCLSSILQNSYRSFEIVLVDQSTGRETAKAIKKIKNIKIKYIKMREKGKVKAVNMALAKTSGGILVFTDDDCIADRGWLKNIYQSFQENKDIIGVFGKVLPYKPQLNRDKICPCTFLNDKKTVIVKPCLHSKNIGFGNNMAFRKEIFAKIGGFKEWLGPGSIAYAAEDGEFALRVLLNGYKILYNPKIVVYHNRWLTKEQYRKQCLFYSCGEVACYGYFAFNGIKLGRDVIKDNFLDSWRKLKFSLKSMLFFKKNSMRLLCHTLQEFYFRLRGLLVAFWFSNKEPITFVSPHRA